MIRDLTGKAKSCPMCGSKRIYMDEPNFDKLFSVTIYCANCGLMGYKNFFRDAKDPIEKTIAYWNTRVSVTEESEVNTSCLHTVAQVQSGMIYIEQFDEWLRNTIEQLESSGNPLIEVKDVIKIINR